jgi:hypothetical protein
LSGRARKPGQPTTDDRPGVGSQISWSGYTYPLHCCECPIEVSGRMEAAAALLAYGLTGQVDLELAALGAARLLGRARLFMETAA